MGSGDVQFRTDQFIADRGREQAAYGMESAQQVQGMADIPRQYLQTQQQILQNTLAGGEIMAQEQERQTAAQNFLFAQQLHEVEMARWAKESARIDVQMKELALESERRRLGDEDHRLYQFMQATLRNYGSGVYGTSFVGLDPSTRRMTVRDATQEEIKEYEGRRSAELDIRYGDQPEATNLTTQLNELLRDLKGSDPFAGDDPEIQRIQQVRRLLSRNQMDPAAVAEAQAILDQYSTGGPQATEQPDSFDVQFEQDARAAYDKMSAERRKEFPTFDAFLQWAKQSETYKAKRGAGR